MSALAEEILRTKTVRAEDGAKVFPLKDSIDAEIGRLLQKLIAEKRPAVSLEVGMAYGVSALFICEAMKKVGGKKHIAIDAYQSTIWNGIGMRHVREAGFDGFVELREQLSQDALPQLVAEGVRVDFAFIDGTHSFDQKIVDLFYVDRMLNVGGVIAFDDCNWPSIHRFCRFVVINRPYRVCGITQGTGPGVRGRMARWVARHSKLARRVLSPEFVCPDEQFGIRAGARCIAFEKLDDIPVGRGYEYKEF